VSGGRPDRAGQGRWSVMYDVWGRPSQAGQRRRSVTSSIPGEAEPGRARAMASGVG
jgi:hypothetical protein